MRRTVFPLLLVGLGLAAAPAEAQLAAQVVASGLSAPVAFVPDPAGPNTFFIVQQGGRIRVLQNGVLLPDLIDLTSSVLFSGEQGLLGLAFPPDAAVSGRFFVNFTDRSRSDGVGNTVVARFTRSPANALTASPATRFDLQWPAGAGRQGFILQPGFGNHKGGNLAFGPDGFLYLGMGDGGSANDPFNNAQNPASLLGKMLRIDVNVPDADPVGYRVPPSNPFVDGQPIAALGEIWDFGMRNPWRWSFDDFGAGATGALIIGDVGQGAREEVNYEPAGAGGRNYGWRIREGLIATPGVPATAAAFQPLVDPLFDYPRTIGRAVTGGYVYRGSALPPQFRGRYFVADSSDSRVASLGLSVNPATGLATVTDAVEHTGELGGSSFLSSVVSFARDLTGELYLCTFGGRILKIVSNVGPNAPQNLSSIVSGRTVTLNWQAPAGGSPPVDYRLEVGSSPGAIDILVTSVGLVTSLTTTNVPNGVYFVRLRAVAGGVLGPLSNEITVTINVGGCTGPPAAPSTPTRGGSGTQVTLSWGAVAGAASYVVEAGSSSGLANLAQIPVATAGLSATAPSGTYFVRVRAVNACGTGAASPEIIVTVP